MRPFFSFLAFFSLLLLAGCGGGRSVEDASQHKEREEANDALKGDAPPRILFLNVAVFRDSDSGGERIQLRDALLAEGRLKSDYSLEDEPRELPAGYLLCLFVDAGGNVLRRALAENPLMRRYEYPGEDGRLQRTIVESDSGLLVLRTGWDPRFRALRVVAPADPIREGTGAETGRRGKEIGTITIEID